MDWLYQLIESFNYAVRGIIQALKQELNMKIHFGLAVVVLVLGLLFDISKLELLILFLVITLVVFAELVNTAIESLSDLLVDDYHPQIKKTKDIAAGAVLITALNAVVVGYIIFFDNLNPLTLNLVRRISRTPIHLTFISLVLVLLVIIAGKAYFKTGTFFQGGMPSGHAAIAFCLVLIIAILTENPLVVTLVLLLALLVAESRLEARIHTLGEIAIGAVIGSVVGLLIFQLMQL